MVQLYLWILYPLFLGTDNSLSAGGCQDYPQLFLQICSLYRDLSYSKKSKKRQGSWCKENHFYSFPVGQADASIYKPKRHLNQPPNFLMSRIDFTLLLQVEFLKILHLPVRQVRNRIHQPDSKIHQPRAIGHYFLCTLGICRTTSKCPS